MESEIYVAFLDRIIRDAAGLGSKREVAEARAYIEGRAEIRPDVNFYKAFEFIGVDEEHIRPVIEDFVLMGYRKDSHVFNLLTNILQ